MLIIKSFDSSYSCFYLYAINILRMTFTLLLTKKKKTSYKRILPTKSCFNIPYLTISFLYVISIFNILLFQRQNLIAFIVNSVKHLK